MSVSGTTFGFPDFSSEFLVFSSGFVVFSSGFPDFSSDFPVFLRHIASGHRAVVAGHLPDKIGFRAGAFRYNRDWISDISLRRCYKHNAVRAI